MLKIFGRICLETPDKHLTSTLGYNTIHYNIKTMGILDSKLFRNQRGGNHGKNFERSTDF